MDSSPRQKVPPHERQLAGGVAHSPTRQGANHGHVSLSVLRSGPAVPAGVPACTASASTAAPLPSTTPPACSCAWSCI